MSPIKGLAAHTAAIFQQVSQLECIKPYILAGGTALALQIDHRKSEDLDFMIWRSSKNQKMEVNWPAIQKELSTVGKVESTNILDMDHVEFVVDGVKFSFYASPRFSPVTKPVSLLNNIRLADIPSILAMKIEVMSRRNAFRDYYDIYAIMKEGYTIKEGLELAGKYSNHSFKTKNMIASLTQPARFIPDAGFKALDPKYDITSQEIAAFIKNSIERPQEKLPVISDINIRENKGDYFLSASVDGEKQVSEKISPKDQELYLKGELSDIDLVKKYYSSYLETPSQEKGLKR